MYVCVCGGVFLIQVRLYVGSFYLQGPEISEFVIIGGEQEVSGPHFMPYSLQLSLCFSNFIVPILIL